MEQWKREIPGYEADAATPYKDKQTLCYPALKQLTLCLVPGSRPVTTWICVSSENSHSGGSQTCAPQLPEPSLFTPAPCQAGVSSLREGRSPGRVMQCSPAFPQVVFLVFLQRQAWLAKCAPEPSASPGENAKVLMAHGLFRVLPYRPIWSTL